jgi:hypothetical protein
LEEPLGAAGAIVHLDFSSSLFTLLPCPAINDLIAIAKMLSPSKTFSRPTFWNSWDAR